MQNIIVSTIDISNNLINTLCENNYRKILYQIAMNGNEFQNFQIKKRESRHQIKTSSVLNFSTWSASSLVPDSRSVSTISYIVKFFSGAAHYAMYRPTVFLPLGGLETNPKKSCTQGQGTTTFTSLSCSVITCTEYNLRKRLMRHVAITL